MIACTTQNYHPPLSYQNEVTKLSQDLKSLNMGNICPLAQNNNNRPPNDLNALLSEVNVPEDMDRSHWIQAFRTHLRSSGRKDIEGLLDFVALAHILKNKWDQRSDLGDSPTLQWKRDEIDLERLELMVFIQDSYFSEEASSKIALSNRILWDQLCQALQEIQHNKKLQNVEIDLDDTCRLIWQARSDYKVWKGGVDKAYNAYLASKPTLPTLTKCSLATFVDSMKTQP